MKKQLAFRKKKKNRKSALLGLAIVAVFCTYMFIRGVELHKTKVELENQIDTLNAQIDDENKRSEELKEFETYTHTKKYAEQVAKDVPGYVYEGEIVFKPDDK